MQTNDLKSGLVSISLTLIFLLITDILFSSLLPLIGLGQFRFSLHILFILYLGLRIRTPYIAIFIFLIEYFHSIFTIEGWAMGTVTGILVCILISFVKDIIHLKTKVMTFLMVQLFQFVWFLIMGIMIYLKLDDMTYVWTRLVNFIPVSVIVSFLSPFVFPTLDRIWVSREDQILEGNG
ncbi:MAG: hypothetical protein ACO20H_09850 [Bacteriovoracaceae bacterium]